MAWIRSGHFFAALLLFSAEIAGAGTYTWNGIFNSTWDESGSWTPSGIPDSNDTAQFNGSGLSTVDIAGSRTVGSLIFSGTKSYTLYNGPLTLSTGNITISSPSSGTVTDTFTANLVLAAAGTFNIASNATLLLSGSVTGSTFTKTGAGTVVIAGDATNGTALTVSAGTLQIGNGGTTGSASQNISVSSGASVIFNRSNLASYDGVITGAGEVTQAGSGTLSLVGPNTFTGGLNLNAGAVSFSSVSNLGSGNINFNGGELQWDTGSTADISVRTVNINAGGAILDTNGNDVTLANAIGNGGSGALTKTGSGTLTLAGDNTYTGGTTISAGTLQIGNGGTTGSISGNVANSGSLAFNRSNALSYSGVISGTGGVTKLGAGTLTLTGANTYTGTTTISAGTLTAGASNTLSSSSAHTVSSGATLNINSGTSQTIASLAGDGSVTVSGTLNAGGDHTSTTFSGVISGTGTFVKSGSGAMTLTGSNTNSNTTISAGTLQIGDGGTMGSLSGNITNNATLTFNRSGGLTHSGTISGTGVVTKTGIGSVTLSGTNTYSGGTILNQGYIAFSSLSNLGTGGLTFNGGGLQWAGTSTTDISTRTVTINSLGAVLDTNGNTVTLANAIGNSGSGGITKIGNGTLILTGDNTFTGDSAILSGTLQIGNGGTSGSIQGNIANFNALVFNRANAITYSGAISGSGTLTQSGSGVLTLEGASTFTGGTNLNAGTIAFSNVSNLGDGALNFNGGTLQWTSGSTADISARTMNFNSGTAILDTNGNDVTLADSIGNSGSGQLTKTGAGTLTLSGNNTYTGKTNINGGTIRFSTLNNLGAGSTIAFTNGGALQWASGSTADITSRTVTFGSGGGTFDTNGNNITLANTISSTSGGGLTKTGAGTLTLSGTNTYTGLTKINEGTVAFSTMSNLGTNGITFDGGTLQWILGNTTDISTETITFNSGGGTLDTNGNDVTIAGNIGNSGSGSLTKIGDGVLKMTGTNTYTGGTIIKGGTLGFVVVSNLGTGGITFDGGALRWTNGSSADASSRTITINSGGGTLDTNGNNPTLSNSIGNNGTGSLTKISSGTLTLAAANTYTGDTIISAGTLQIGNGGTAGSVAGNIVNNSALTFNRSDSPTYSGVISGSGTLTKLGAGTLTLTGNNTLTGTTTISAGTLQLGNGGSTGSLAGNITNNSALTFNRSGSLDYGSDISGTGSLTKTGSGTVRLGGTNTFTGGITISGGVLAIGAAGSAGSIVSNVVNNAILIFNRTTDYSYAGAISGSGSVYKVNSNTLTLTGSNTYAGTTFVQGGILQIGNGGTSGSISGNIDNNTSVVFNRSNSSTYTGAISNTGSVTKNGSGTLTLSGNSSYSGGTTFNAGTVAFSTSENLGTGSLTFNGGAIQWGSGNTYDISNRTVTINSSGATFDTNGNDVSLGSNPIGGSGSLTKNGSGMLVLNGTNTYSGGTHFNGGTVRFSSLNNLGSGGLAFNGGGLQWASSSADITTRVVTIDPGGATLDTDTNTVTLSGSLGGSGGLTKTGNGTLILAGNNTYTGTTTVDQGTLQLGNGGTLGSIAGSIVTNANLTFNRFDDITYSDVVTGSGNVNKNGSNTLTFTSDQAYTGTTFVGGGTLQLGNGGTTGSVTGIIDVSDGAKLAFNHSDDITVSNSIIGYGSVTQASSATLTLAGSSSYRGGTYLNTGTIAFTLAENLGLGGLNFNGGTLKWNSGSTADVSDHLITINSGGGTLDTNGNDITFANSIGNNGTGAWTKTGEGTLTLQLAPTNTGGITISQGTLKIEGEAYLTENVVNNASLVLNRSIDIIISSNISGTGSVTQLSNKKVTLTGDNTYTGTTTISSGTLQIGNGGSSGSIAGNISNGGILTFNRTGSLIYTGAISGSGSLIKSGSGTLIATGAISNTGGTTINAGTLQIGNAGSTGSISGNILNNGALVFNRTGSFTYSGNVSGSGSLTQNKSSSALSITGSLTHTGGTTINAGELYIGNGGTSGSITGDVVNNHSFGFNRSDNITFAGNITGSGSFIKKGTGTIALAGNITQTAVSIDGGKLQIQGTTTLSGLTLIGGDVEFAGSNAATGVIQVHGAHALDINGGSTVSSSSANLSSSTGAIGTANVAGAGSSWAVAGNITATNVSGSISVSNGGLISAGSLSGGSSLPVTLDNGTFQFTGSGTSSNPFTLNSGGGTIQTGSGITQTMSGAISGAGALTKTGAGTLKLSGTNTYTGGTIVSAGTLAVNGSLSGSVSIAAGATLGGSGVISGNTTVQGTLAPGNSPGLLTFENDLTLGNATTTTMEIQGTTRGTTYDAIDVGGILTYDGTLVLNITSGLGISTFDLFAFSSGTELGDFDSITFSGGVYTSTWTEQSPGLWTATDSGQTFTFATGTGDLSVVPEPGILSLLVAGLMSTIMRRRRRWSRQ